MNAKIFARVREWLHPYWDGICWLLIGLTIFLFGAFLDVLPLMFSGMFLIGNGYSEITHLMELRELEREMENLRTKSRETEALAEEILRKYEELNS